MNKIVIVIFVFFLSQSEFHGQSFSVNYDNVEIIGSVSPIYTYHGTIKNNSSDTLFVRMTIIPLEMPESWEMGMCTVNGCFLPGIFMDSFKVYPQKSEIAWVEFFTHDVDGVGSANILFENIIDPNDAIEINLTVDTGFNHELEENNLSWSDLKIAYNHLNGEPLILSILGVNCPPCRTHRNDIRDQVLNNCDNPNLNWFVIWFEDPGHPAVRADAEMQALLINDDRVTQWWYDEHQSVTPKNDSIAILFGDFSWMGCRYAWDMSMIFDSNNQWDSEAPVPEYCMAKVSGCCNSYNINNFVTAVNELNVCEETTAIDNEINADKKSELLTIFPNPFSVKTSVNYQIITNSTNRLEIYNSSGRLVNEYDLDSTENSIELSLENLPGVYYCLLRSNNQIVGIKKIVKL